MIWQPPERRQFGDATTSSTDVPAAPALSRRRLMMAGAVGTGIALTSSVAATATPRSGPAASPGVRPPAPPRPPHGGPTVNVMDHGAAGDGVTDDAPAFTSALAELARSGGGTLLVPAHTYLVNDAVLLTDNVHIRSTGAVLTKNAGPRVLFASLSGQHTGYGSGVRRVRAEGLVFRGDFANDFTFCGFALHHAQDVIVENCSFIQTQGTGHCLDLCGCERIAVRNCTFEGFDNFSTSGYNKTECIQLDQSRVYALSYADDPESYDGLFTRDVEVRGCRFLPVEVNGVSYPCGNPVGAHSSREAHRYANVAVIDNHITDPHPDPSNPELDERNIHSAWKGVVHFPTVVNLQVRGNTFTQTRPGSVRGIAVFSINESDLDSVPPSEYPQSGPVAPIRSEHILISHNTFVGFRPTDTDPAQEVIWIRGVEHGEVTHVTITDNQIIDTRTADGAGTVAIRALHGMDVTIRDNRILESAGGVRLERTTRLAVADNRITAGPGPELPAAITVTDGSRIGRVVRNTTRGFAVPVSTDGAGGHIVVERNS